MMLAVSALALGVLHGFGADHLMAIIALTANVPDSGARRAKALAVAVQFACGHALLLASGTLLVLLLGWSVPIAVERGGEFAGGCLLLALGGFGLWGICTGRIYGHAHHHDRFHMHASFRGHEPASIMHSSYFPPLLGAVFAVSSLRGLTMLAPLEPVAAQVPHLFLLVGLFAVGILLSMSLFGVLFARVMSTRAIGRLGRVSGGAMSIASMLLGVYWVLSA